MDRLYEEKSAAQCESGARRILCFYLHVWKQRFSLFGRQSNGRDNFEYSEMYVYA